MIKNKKEIDKLIKKYKNLYTFKTFTDEAEEYTIFITNNDLSDNDRIILEIGNNGFKINFQKNFNEKDNEKMLLILLNFLNQNENNEIWKIRKEFGK